MHIAVGNGNEGSCHSGPVQLHPGGIGTAGGPVSGHILHRDLFFGGDPADDLAQRFVVVAVAADLAAAKTELNNAITNGDAELNQKIADLTAALNTAKSALEAADEADKTALNAAITSAQNTLQAAIDEVAVDLESTKAELDQKIMELEKKENELDDKIEELNEASENQKKMIFIIAMAIGIVLLLSVLKVLIYKESSWFLG